MNIFLSEKKNQKIKNILKKNKIKIFIICRSDSKRFPGKISKKIFNYSLLEILSLRLIKVFGKENVIICSSNKERNNILKNIANKLDIDIFFGDNLNIFKRLIDSSKKYKANHIVRITGDNPLTDPETLKKMLISYMNKKIDYMYTNSLFPGLRSEIFSVKALKKCRTLSIDQNSSEYLTYFFLRKDIFKIRCFIQKKISEREKKLSITIDTFANFKKLKDLITKNNSNIYITKKTIIKNLEEDKTKKKIIKKIPLKTKKYNVRLKTDPKNFNYINLEEFKL